MRRRRAAIFRIGVPEETFAKVFRKSAVPPVPTAPTITYNAIVGNGRIGSVHVADVRASGYPAPSFTYQWRRNGVDIAGALSSSYTTVAADDGTTLTVSAIATNASGSTPQNISAGRAITYALPEITNAGVLNRALIGLSSSVSGFAFTGSGTVTYQWYADGNPTAGAINATRTPAEATNGRQIWRRTFVTNSAGQVFADTPPLTATYQSPIAGAAIVDQIFDEDTGIQTVATAAGFTVPGDADLSGVTFSLDSPLSGVTIDEDSGVVSVDTSQPRAATLISVRATNSGGSLARTFSLTITASGSVPNPRPLSHDVVLVGHSLVNHIMPRVLRHFLADQGGTAVVNEQVINGSSLEYNWNNSTIAEQGIDARALVSAGDVEVLVLTEGGPIHINFYTGRYTGFWDQWAGLASANGVDQVFLYQIWPSLAVSGGTWAGWRAKVDAERWLFEQIYSRTSSALLIPGGGALAALYDAVMAGTVPDMADAAAFGAQVFVDEPDPIHLTGLGNYFIALVQYATIYRRSPIGLPRQVPAEFGPDIVDLPADKALRLQQIAWQAVQDDPHTGLLGPAPIVARWNVTGGDGTITFHSHPPVPAPTAIGGAGSITFGA